MATFGNTLDAYALDPTTGLPLPGVELYAWADETGGTPPLLSILSGLDGSFGWEYDTTADGQWVSAGLTGPRVYVPNNDALAARATTVYVDERLATKANAATVGTLSARVDTTEARVGTVEDEVAGRLSAPVLSSTYAGVDSALAPVDRFPDPAKTFITTFQTGHGWTGTGMVTDTTDFVLGTQSLSLTGTGTAGTRAVQKYGGPAVDLSSRMVGVLVKVNDQSKLQYMQLWLGNTNMANANIVQPFFGFMNSPISTYHMHDNEWTWVYFSPTDYVVGTGGTPNMSNVTDWQIRFTESAGSTAGAPLVAHVAALAHFPKQTAFPNGVVTFSFDDEWESQYTRAMPVLDKYGYGAQLYIIADGLGTPGWLSLAQLHDMEDNHGWEISGHAYAGAVHNVGYPSLSEAAMLEDAAKLKAFLRREGFKGADHFAWPLGFENKQRADLLKRYFSTARHVNGLYAASLYPPNPMRSAALPVEASTTVAAITGKIDDAYAKGKWLQLMLHDIVPSGATGGTRYDLAKFTQVVDYCATKGIPVRTVSQVIRAMNAQA